MVSELISIEEEIKRLKEILEIHKISEDPHFKQWFEVFKRVYSDKSADIQLYIVSALLFFVGNLFSFKFIINDNKDLQETDINYGLFKEIKDHHMKQYGNNSLFDFEYFNPLLKLSQTEDKSILYSLLSTISDHLFNLQVRPEFIFDYLNQNIISPVIRHKSGEYYTPSFLVKKMVDEAYDFGDKVLDPCCGTGNFLIELVKQILGSEKSDNDKVKAINNLHGYDINPISVFLTKINIMFLTKKYLSDISLNLFNFDSLFQNNNNRFDLIIGNPPWYTFSDIDSIDYQDKIKKLAEELEIKPLPKNILNIEISALFFYHAKNTFMNDNAKIFFVITKGVITGSHASRFRNFRGFNSIKIWFFDTYIEKIFNIDFICIYAQKENKVLEPSKIEIPAFYYALGRKYKKLDYFESVNLRILKKEILVPYSHEVIANKTYIKKLISKENKEKLLPSKTSDYKKLFHKGADLNPRNLIFVSYEEIGDLLVKISPDERIFKRAKKPWVKKEFKEETVEKDYIFKVIKSTELVKFGIFDSYSVFLPLSKEDLRFNYEELPKNAKNFYDRINKIYLKHKKETTKNKSLMDNLNRWAKLINKRQISKIKVVYNNSGSILNSAVIQGDFLITGDLSFFDTDDLNEAHYLSAILNSPIMAEQVRIKKSSRHIFKIPFETPIKLYDSNNENHLKIVQLSKEAHKITQSVIKEVIEISKGKIQNRLAHELAKILTQINDLVLLELK